MTTQFKGLGRTSSARIPSSPNPSPEILRAFDFSSMHHAATAGVEEYLKAACPGAVAGPLSLRRMAELAGASDLLDGIKALELELDRLERTKAEAETLQERFGRWEVLSKALIRAIAIARSKKGEEFA